MTEIIVSFNPILIFAAVILTIMASYTALDLFTLIKTSESNQRFLFLGGTFSLGIGIWIMNFIGIVAININASGSYNIPLTLLSMIFGISFTGMAFNAVIGRQPKTGNLLAGSFFLTMAVLSIHVTGMFAIGMHVQFGSIVFLISTLIIFASFLFSLWMLFYSKSLSYSRHIWIKPLSALIIAGAVAEGYFLLIRSSSFYPNGEISRGGGSPGTFLIFLVLFAAILILSGLIASSTLMSKRLEASDTHLHDIQAALDESSIVAITDPKGIITYVNDKFVEISKYEEYELMGKNHNILNSGYHSPEFFHQLWKTIGSGEIWKGEIRNKAKDGSYYWVHTTIVPFMNANGKPYQYLAIRNDITERKKTEEVLHQQDKLAAVGQLAAGVAHEIRNPLTTMKGYTELLQLDETNEERQEYLSIILDEIDRVNNIVEDFMVLAKPKAAELEERDIIPIIKNVISFLEFEARKRDVKIRFEYERDIIQIECDENRLKQVFLNFIKNGIEAMPDGGDITVRAAIINNQVQIAIQDTGVGIPQEKLKNIGEPFFTTKKNGNGLGLMVSFKIIESHNGKVFIESELNKGTTFNIVLPAKSA